MTTLHTRSLFTRCRPILAPAILIFALAGCGSDGDDGAPGAPGPEGPEGPPGPSIGPLSALNIEIDSIAVDSAPVVDFTASNQSRAPFAALTLDDLRFTIAQLRPRSSGPGYDWRNYITTTEIPCITVGPISTPTKDCGPGGGVEAGAGNTGDGELIVDAVASGAPKEIWTVTFTSDTEFTVSGTVSGAQGATGTVGTQYVSDTPAGRIKFTVTAGGTAFAAGDTFTMPRGIATQGTRENNGTLVNHGDGSYTYTFNKDITQDATYNGLLTHRVGIQTRGDIPMVNATEDFVPAGGSITRRDIVQTANCNECHDALEAHDARIETKYCVTCHNPSSKDANSIDPNASDPDESAAVRYSGAVDFKILIHKLHRGASLPSGKYAIWGYRDTKHDFSDIHFPQDIRNCTKCHDGADAETPQGNNWNDVPSMEACGSCHDEIKFNKLFDEDTEPDGHKGGVVTDNSECLTCHAAGRIAGSVAESHTIFEKVTAANFEYSILEICGVAVVNGVADTDGAIAACQAGGTPTVKFKVTNPNDGSAYNIRSPGGDPAFTDNDASLNVLMAWDTRDYNNDGGSGSRPARANSVNVRTSGSVVANPDGSFTVTMPTLPTADPDFILPQGTGTVAMEGHPAGPGRNGVFEPASCDPDIEICDDVRATVKAAVAYFGITDADPVPRRQVVDITTKCDRCHDLLSLHGNNRSDEAQLCVMCHNPRNTDIARRVSLMLPGKPPGVGIDDKTEEAIDFKRLIHGIHAAAATNYDGTIAHGFREKGLVIYGYSGNEHDYSHLRFPGVLSKCTTCHLDGTYTLADRSADGGGNWELPAQTGILGSTIDTGDGTPASRALRADDASISPTAAVCSACHDDELAMEHMEFLGGALFGFNQTAIEGNTETCAVCHGPGAIGDVAVVHTGQATEVIP